MHIYKALWYIFISYATFILVTIKHDLLTVDIDIFIYVYINKDIYFLCVYIKRVCYTHIVFNAVQCLLHQWCSHAGFENDSYQTC